MKRETSVSITVRKGKAYLPTEYWSEKHRFWVSAEPVLVADLTLESLMEAIGRAKAFGNPPIQLPEDPEEWKRWVRRAKRYAPELKVAGVKSWKEFGQGARSYSILWLEDKVLLRISGPFTKGVFLMERSREFPPDAPLREVVEALLEEIRKVPELWEGRQEGSEEGRTS